MVAVADLKDKAVLVTGASTGIGAAVARGFAESGARVVVHYNRSREAAEALVGEITLAGGRAMALGADVTEAGMAERLVARTVELFGRLDVLVNNAGDVLARTPFTETDDAFADQLIDLNVRPVVTACRAAIARFRRQGGGGNIINTTSISARHGGGPGVQLYASSKAYVQTLTRGLAREFAPEGIRVNAVSPGVIATPIHARNSSPELMESFRKMIPMGRIGVPEDCVGAYLFLASDALSGYVTGQVIEVNGGQLMA
jgi:3-oxoacyl-[acyl-carrier protein] reductase